MNHELALRSSLEVAVTMWATKTTDAESPSAVNLIRDKTAALIGEGERGTAAGLFIHCKKGIDRILPGDVELWMAYLRDFGLKEATIYARVSKVSSFYKWLQKRPAFREIGNPVDLVRPKAPKHYQSRSTQSLTDKQVQALFRVIGEDIQAGLLTGRRDEALLKLFFATGKRREEIIRLTRGDVEWNGEYLVITARHKGGLYSASEVEDVQVYNCLWVYLEASGRDFDSMSADSPLWLRHDRGANGAPLSSHGFVKMLKKYARRAGIGDIHLHQTRHTVARWAGEELGDMSEVQSVLGHSNINTTRVYLQRVGIKRDKISKKVADRLNDSKA